VASHLKLQRIPRLNPERIPDMLRNRDLPFT
jgi:hypothetical protein